MKALTLTQPWATLVVRGVKHYETRSWALRLPFLREPDCDHMPGHYGPQPIRLAIHASARMRSADIEFATWLRDVVGVLDTVDLPLGSVVGTVRYMGSEYSYPETRAEINPSALELELGDWSDGRLLWRLEDPIEFAEPIPIPGAQRIWNWLAPEYVPAIAAMAGVA